MRLSIISLILIAFTAGLGGTQPPKTLDIYAVDVEGGKATLIVSPSRESLLIDTGNVGDGAQRDADRIMAAIRDADSANRPPDHHALAS